MEARGLGGTGPGLLFRTVQDDIREYIIEHGLQGGDPLPPETHLARDLGIGRHSVREAVKALESLGILETRPGRGLFVRPFSLDPILDNLAYSLLFDRSSIVHLLDVREQLEVGLLPRAIAAVTPVQLDLLRDLLRCMREKVDRGVNFQAEDQVFHRTLAEASGNPLAVKLLGVFWVVLNRVRDQSIAIDDVPERNWHNHARILESVVSGDAQAAQHAMVSHFQDLEARIERAGLRRSAAGANGRPVSRQEIQQLPRIRSIQDRPHREEA